MPGDWITINSATMLDSHCGDTVGFTLAEALDGTDWWRHNVIEEHWFILDLLEEYTISKFRGRSLTTEDPIKADVYISNDKGNFGAAVLVDVASWQDTLNWQEENLITPKNGRYIKVIIKATEAGAPGSVMWGWPVGPHMRIFEPYGEPPTPPYPTELLKKGLITAYHCFMSAYILAKQGDYDPLKLPDGTLF